MRSNFIVAHFRLHSSHLRYSTREQLKRETEKRIRTVSKPRGAKKHNIIENIPIPSWWERFEQAMDTCLTENFHMDSKFHKSYDEF